MPNPKLAPVILLSPVENGYVAYDPVADHKKKGMVGLALLG